MIEVSAEAWHAIHYLVTPWQYLPRLGVCRGLACYSISCRALTVSAEAWHAILYLATPWLLRLGSICLGLAAGMLFYIISRLGSICRGLVFCSISCHALAVSAEAWHSILISYHALAVSAMAWYAFLSYRALAVSVEAWPDGGPLRLRGTRAAASEAESDERRAAASNSGRGE